MDAAPNFKNWFYLATGVSALLAGHLFFDQYRRHAKTLKKAELKKKKLKEKKYKRKVQQESVVLNEQQSVDANYHLKSHQASGSYKLIREPRFDKNLVQKIVLTGGPCAGKTTAMTYISTKLRERGLNVLIVPEVATIIATGGGLINVQKLNPIQVIKLQSVIMKAIMDLEDHFCELADITGEPTVILCDRGVMDGKAYMKPEGWQVLLDENGFNIVNLRDKRYDAVIHLVTAADGAEEYYQLENNTARYENSKSLAIEVDRNIRNAWVGHPALIIADNHFNKNFEEKIMKVFDAVLHVVGLPKAPKFYRKYLLKKTNTVNCVPEIPERYKTETVEMEDTFLKSKDPKVERKIRKRGVKDSYTYIYSVTSYNVSRESITDHEFKNDGIERKRQVSAREFVALSEERDPTRKTLEKLRQCFIYEEEYFFIDTFTNINEEFSLLNIEANRDINSIRMPPFIQIDKDVTDMISYTSYNVSMITPENEDSAVEGSNVSSP